MFILDEILQKFRDGGQQLKSEEYFKKEYNVAKEQLQIDIDNLNKTLKELDVQQLQNLNLTQKIKGI